MRTRNVLVCPKCGSSEIEWHRGSRGDFRECRACGHIGSFKEKIVHDEGEDIWP